jgi:hypothetical protein
MAEFAFANKRKSHDDYQSTSGGICYFGNARAAAGRALSQITARHTEAFANASRPGQSAWMHVAARCCTRFLVEKD